MLDLKQIRSDPARYREALARRGAAEALDELLELDGRRRELLPEIEDGRARQNTASEAIAETKRAGGDASEAITEMRGLSGRIKQLEGELAEVEDPPRRAGRDPSQPSRPGGARRPDRGGRPRPARGGGAP